VGYNFCRRHYGSIFIHLANVAFQNREITRNSDNIRPYSSSRSSKVIDLGVNRKLICDFLLIINNNFGSICYRFSRYWCLKLENGWIFPPHPCLRIPLGGNPLECRDDIWHQKTRIVGLPDGEEIMTLLAFSFWHNTGSWRTDRRTDRHVTIAKTRASMASRG